MSEIAPAIGQHGICIRSFDCLCAQIMGVSKVAEYRLLAPSVESHNTAVGKATSKARLTADSTCSNMVLVRWVLGEISWQDGAVCAYTYVRTNDSTTGSAHVRTVKRSTKRHGRGYVHIDEFK